MKRNPIDSALSILLRNTGKTLHILKLGIIENGWFRMTDLLAAICATKGMDVEEFPKETMAEYPETPISPMILDGLVGLLPTASNEDSRESLKYAFVNRKKREAMQVKAPMAEADKEPPISRER